jgi:hypothetical protein
MMAACRLKGPDIEALITIYIYGVPDISGVSLAYSASRRLTRMRCKINRAPPTMRTRPATPPIAPPAITAVSDFLVLPSSPGAVELSAAVVLEDATLDEVSELLVVEDGVGVTDSVVVSSVVMVSVSVDGSRVVDEVVSPTTTLPGVVAHE